VAAALASPDLVRPPSPPDREGKADAAVLPGSNPAPEPLPPLVTRAFEQSQQGWVLADAEARLVRVNPAFCALTGFRPEELIGRSAGALAAGGCECFAKLDGACAQSGAFAGEVVIRRKDGSAAPAWLQVGAVRDAAGVATHFQASLLDISPLKRNEQEILHRAQHDALTGLANRVLLRDRLVQAIASARRSGEQFAVLFLDLDRFKNINDSLGHAAGDEVLKRVARRLRRCVRESDTLARMGGDEFVLLLRNVKDSRGPIAVARTISQQLYRPFDIDGRELSLTSSIGISLYPQDGSDGDQLIDRADTAMYRAKERGQNSYAYFRPNMTTLVQERLLLEQSLHRALERNEFVLTYQPQLDIAAGRVTGGEALLRWQHPELGLLSPDRFIPLAEETGLIRPIGAWVLRTVCAQMRAWHAEGLSPLRMAVNLSGHQILRTRHTDALRAVLGECWVPTEGLELEIEITESALQTGENALASANLLKSLGVTLAIDDFGTGYSSMMALKLLPIDRLKIDRSFIEGVPGDPNHASMAAAMIAMGKALGLKVLAEGVETGEQMAFLRERGCDEAQGYLLGKPLPPAEFERYLRDARGLPADP
jgi:diguanylate cyclase (GGDEF)-like protein/PAS domain S-box-containing protein